MKLKHLDILPDEKDPFANCKLGRQPYAEVLTNIVANYAGGFVLAINNEWGTGKTTFVKMWQQLLKNQGHKTLYFNAWENDFENGALTALMAELSSLKEDKTEETFKKLLKTGAKLAKGAIPIILKAFAAKYLDKEVLQELFGEVTDNVAEMFNSQIEEYTSKKEELKVFKQHLTEYVAQTTEDGKPIVFLIDELDRCRPNYAVDVLEKVKHFFDVSGIVFVLSVDKEQLAHAIRGAYGSDKINADEYLRRFIDLEYSIPMPNIEQFCSYLIDYFEFKNFFHSNDRIKINSFVDDLATFSQVSLSVFEGANLTLRQQEKMLAHVRLSLDTFSTNSYVFPSLLVILIYLKTYNSSVFYNIKSKRYEHQQLIDTFEKEIPFQINNDSTGRKIILGEAQLIFLYNNYLSHEKKMKLLIKDTDEEVKTELNSKLDSENLLARILSFYSHNMNLINASIKHLLDRIELTQPFVEQ